MENDYECPRCHNVFPSYNKIMHDARCTEQNPLPLNKNNVEITQQIGNKEDKKENIPKLNELNNDRNEMDIEDNNNINSNKNNNNLNFNIFNSNNNNNNNNYNDFNFNFFNDSNNSNNNLDFGSLKNNNNNINNNINDFVNSVNEPPKEDFPNVFECNICHQMFLEKEKKDHMMCHDLEKEDKKKAIRISTIDIEEQKKIEKQIENNNKKKRNNQNRINQNNNNINNIDNIFYHNIEDINNFNNNNNNLNNIFPNINEIDNNINLNYNNNHINHNNNFHFEPLERPRHRIVPFRDINNRFSIRAIFDEMNLNDGNNNRRKATDKELLNNLPETQIEDVSKLDAEKRNCTICLEDFKNKDKALILPCIHLFHKNCIKNWLKKQNNCPICKFKLTRSNINSQNNNFQ